MARRPSGAKPGQRYDRRGKLIITRLSLHEQVIDKLRQMIVTGELPAGKKIRVNELAEDLQVSLTPLREALKVLAGEQLVELTPNRGARVAPLVLEEIKQVFEVMAGIEGLAAELAAQRIAQEQLAQLEEMHTRMRLCHDAGDKSAYFDLNRKIHDLLVEFAGNPILVQTRAQLALRTERARFIAVSSDTHRMEAMKDHDDLMAALRARDANTASRVWRRHLISSGEEMCRVLQAWEAEEAAGSQRATG